MSGARIVLDVWGGEGNMDHVARFLPAPDAAFGIAMVELEAGFLINMRTEVAWGSLTPFDDRAKVAAGSGQLQ